MNSSTFKVINFEHLAPTFEISSSPDAKMLSMALKWPKDLLKCITRNVHLTGVRKSMLMLFPRMSPTTLVTCEYWKGVKAEGCVRRKNWLNKVNHGRSFIIWANGEYSRSYCRRPFWQRFRHCQSPAKVYCISIRSVICQYYSSNGLAPSRRQTRQAVLEFLIGISI